MKLGVGKNTVAVASPSLPQVRSLASLVLLKSGTNVVAMRHCVIIYRAVKDFIPWLIEYCSSLGEVRQHNRMLQDEHCRASVQPAIGKMIGKSTRYNCTEFDIMQLDIMQNAGRRFGCAFVCLQCQSINRVVFYTSYFCGVR